MPKPLRRCIYLQPHGYSHVAKKQLEDARAPGEEAARSRVPRGETTSEATHVGSE